MQPQSLQLLRERWPYAGQDGEGGSRAATIALRCDDRSYNARTASASTSTPLGKPATSTAARAG